MTFARINHYIIGCKMVIFEIYHSFSMSKLIFRCKEELALLPPLHIVLLWTHWHPFVITYHHHYSLWYQIIPKSARGSPLRRQPVFFRCTPLLFWVLPSFLHSRVLQIDLVPSLPHAWISHFSKEGGGLLVESSSQEYTGYPRPRDSTEGVCVVPALGCDSGRLAWLQSLPSIFSGPLGIWWATQYHLISPCAI